MHGASGPPGGRCCDRLASRRETPSSAAIVNRPAASRAAPLRGKGLT